jgi:hypothetical protein
MAVRRAGHAHRDAAAVRLSGRDGAAVELRPTGYEFPRPTGQPGDWDANWLVVHGEVRTAAGEAWAFDHPCLTTWEARELARWLRAVAAGDVSATEAPTEDSAGMLVFTEPNLGFSVASSGAEDVVVRAHLSLEAVVGRPGADLDASYDLYAFSLPLRVGRAHLVAAAQEWEQGLARFPER